VSLIRARRRGLAVFPGCDDVTEQFVMAGQRPAICVDAPVASDSTVKQPRRGRPRLDRGTQYAVAVVIGRGAAAYWMPAFAGMTPEYLSQYVVTLSPSLRAKRRVRHSPKGDGGSNPESRLGSGCFVAFAPRNDGDISSSFTRQTWSDNPAAWRRARAKSCDAWFPLSRSRSAGRCASPAGGSPTTAAARPRP
jgi:hypothetical protein